MMIRAVLTFAKEHEDDDESQAVSQKTIKAFRGMLGRNLHLSHDQRSWLRSAYERVTGIPQYENLVSAGRVPTGREVPLPDLLKRENLPLSPPRRKPLASE